jgi:hypothetical protein
MLIVKPAGSLSVTYVRTPSTVPTPTAAFDAVPSSAQGSVRERLAQLDELHGAGVVTDEEYAAKRAKILEDL